MFVDQTVNVEEDRRKKFIDDMLNLCKVLSKKHEDMKKSSSDVQAAQKKQEPNRTPADEGFIKYMEMRATDRVLPVYQELRNALADLGSNYLYQPICVTDEMMLIDPRSTTAVRAHARQSYLEKLHLDAPIGVYIYYGGGPYPRMIQVWAVAPPVPAAHHMAVTTMANANFQLFGTREMKREFMDKYLPAHLSSALLRNVWQTLDGPLLPDRMRHSDVDDRLLQWLACNDVSVECFADLRTLNGADGDRFDVFWNEMAKYLKLEIGQGAEERRAASSSDVTYASRVISVPILLQRVREAVLK